MTVQDVMDISGWTEERLVNSLTDPETNQTQTYKIALIVACVVLVVIGVIVGAAMYLHGKKVAHKQLELRGVGVSDQEHNQDLSYRN